MDATSLTRNWWIIALRGVAGILFGLLALIWPGITLGALVLLFGSYALVEGVFNVIAAVRGRTVERAWWALLLEGLISIGAGIVTFVLPGLTALVLVYVVATWALITGALEIVAAVRLRQEITDEWWLGASGVLSIIFGVILMLFPGAGALALVLWIGAYSIVFGALLVALAFRLRSWRAEARTPMARAA